MAPPPGRVRLYTPDGDLSLTATLDEQHPTMTGGYGGWEQLERRYKLPILEWQRGELYAMSFGILLRGDSVEQRVAIFEQMCRTPGASDPPPTIHADGPLPRSRRVRWVIDQPEFGASKWSGQKRVYQQITVLLVQFEEDERLRLLRKPKAKRHRTYKVPKGGRTLQKIAADKLDSAKKWREIRDLNPKKTRMHPKKIPAGTELRLP